MNFVKYITHVILLFSNIFLSVNNKRKRVLKEYNYEFIFKVLFKFSSSLNYEPHPIIVSNKTVHPFCQPF